METAIFVVQSSAEGEECLQIVCLTPLDRCTFGITHRDSKKGQDFEDQLPDCELGSTPPFGNLYEMKVIVDKKLTAEETIAFCSGKHKELIQLAYADFEKLVKPEVVEFSVVPE